jgi:Protein of unknown function (DUF998)
LPGTDRRGWPVLAGIAAFWLGTIVAGALAPGYSARADYISSLAGRGSEVAGFGIANLLVLGSTHLLAAFVVRGAVRVPLALAGLAGLTVAAFRTSCPGGAAGCGFEPGAAPPDLADAVHGLAVIGYELALVAAMLTAAVRLARARPALAAGAALAAVVSVALALQIGGADNGWWQRAWLVVNTGWLAWLGLASVRELPAQLPGAARRDGPAASPGPRPER